MSENKHVLLAVLAHPDDETFGMGGTLALYAHKGVEVHLVCATRGEVGSVDPKFLQGFESIGERRESELCCAADLLGLAGVHFLGYRDSGMPGSPDNLHPKALAAQPVEEVARKVAHYIRMLRPQVVVTNDPIGGYKHPDHIAVHRATLRAFELVADPAFIDEFPPFQPSKLYYNIFPKGFLKIALLALPLLGQDPRHFGRNKDIDLVDIVKDGDFPVHARINYRSVARLKDEASACHASQLAGGPPNRGPLHWIDMLIGEKDTYMRALPEANRHLHEKDLFEGIHP
jgi:N-acetyl-1-D-myo-inositol-2-amino-2-deoxy-alpha-D-glucopyranoside deacetylase